MGAGNGAEIPDRERLNALSGIGGVQTRPRNAPGFGGNRKVLMPCRALEAFRPTRFSLGPTGTTIKS